MRFIKSSPSSLYRTVVAASNLRISTFHKMPNIILVCIFVFAIPSITGIHSFSRNLQSPQGNAGDFLITALVLGNNFSVSSCFVLL